MKDAAVIAALVLLLASSHMLLSSRKIRPRLVARLGEKGFLAAYSVVALVFFVPLFSTTSRTSTGGRSCGRCRSPVRSNSSWCSRSRPEW